MTQPSDSVNVTSDKPPARPAMPSGTVRARRMHPRYRKAKARADTSLEPAAPSAEVIKSSDKTRGNKKQPCQAEKSSRLAQQIVEQLSTRGEAYVVGQGSQVASVQGGQVEAQDGSSVIGQGTMVTSVDSKGVGRSSEVKTKTIGVARGCEHEYGGETVVGGRSMPGGHCTQAIVHHQMIGDRCSIVGAHSVCSSPMMRGIISGGGEKNVHGQSGHESGRLIVEMSPPSQKSVCTEHGEDGAERGETVAEAARGETEDIDEEVCKLVDKMKVSREAGRARPLICQDITNSNADTLRISRLPRGVTYDRLVSMVEPFGEIEDLVWTAGDPYVCDVTYRDPAAAREAKHFLGDALVGNDSERSLKAELRSRDPGAQLFVGDLTPDVSEEMLEEKFSQLVGERVCALLKRDAESFSPIGYGFLSFESESSANFALVAGHRMKVGNACVRVGRAERNTYLYVSNLGENVSMDELKQLFGKYGNLIEEDTTIVRRSYAFVRYRNRGAAERAKRSLDKTQLKGHLSVRYAEAEGLKGCVAVQFHSSVPRPPSSLKELVVGTFSKYGNCSVEIPRLQNGMWRKVAFVTFHGDAVSANVAALEAVQSVRFVSSLPVCCQFARELIPRLPARGLRCESGVVGGDAAGEKREPFVAQQSGVQPAGADFVPVYVPISALNQQAEEGFGWQHVLLPPGGAQGVGHYRM